MHRAIETRYNGRFFRSRLEARYAVFFDALGLSWDYEPEGFELDDGLRYLPDFWIHFSNGSNGSKPGCWVEVKPGLPNETEIRKLGLLVLDTGHSGYFVCGAPDKLLVFNVNPEKGETVRMAEGFAGIALRGAKSLPRMQIPDAARRAISARFEFKSGRAPV